MQKNAKKKKHSFNKVRISSLTLMGFTSLMTDAALIRTMLSSTAQLCQQLSVKPFLVRPGEKWFPHYKLHWLCRQSVKSKILNEILSLY